MAATSNNKDVIYVDIDDEITTIIDKVRNSEAKVVALVLPKRATVFQSIVNMKLLKRSAEAAHKHTVLITTESGLMPLAGTVGLHVAATPQSKPEIPAIMPQSNENEPIMDGASEEDEGDSYTAENAGSRPVGELANKDAVETLALPDEEAADERSADNTDESQKPVRERHLFVPNFNKFRAGLFIGIFLLIVLVIGAYAAAVILPKAAIGIATDTSSVSVSISPILDTSAQTLNTTKLILPAKTEQQQKTSTQQVATTGQKNTGSTATGSVTMTAQKCSGSGNPTVVAAGTGISYNNLTFITQEDATFHITSFSNGCGIFSSDSVSISAQSPGTKYNVSSVPFTVSGRPDVTANGSASGGTDNIIQTVTQADIDSAKQKLSSQDASTIKSGLSQTLTQDGYYPIPATFVTGTPTITSSNNVDDQATSVTVTQTVSYAMSGARQTDIDALINANVSGQINASDQSILDDGLANATFNVISVSGTTQQLSLQSSATVGPDINTATLKKQLAGKKVGDVKSQISNIPGVTNVTVNLSPFWVSTVPSNSAKVTITVTGASARAHGNS